MTFLFLPTNKAEMRLKGWDSIDIILVTGDAYIDHPSFGAAIIGRYLESKGYKVGIMAQPDWRSPADFLVFGRPNLFFGVTSGNLDSMLANYSPEKKKRRRDEYTEGAVAGKRPDRATIVYSNMLRSQFPGIPIVLGGIEASLRRFAHYDYWDNKVRRSLLFDSRADLLVYGMGEKAIEEVADRLRNGVDLKRINNTAYLSDNVYYDKYLELPSFEEVSTDNKAYAASVKMYYEESVKKKPVAIVQKCQNKYTIIEPPDALAGPELDRVYLLPFTREAHPKYKEQVPAFSFVKHSIVSHRGCYGGCSFCTLNLHQGKYIESRTQASMLEEIAKCIVPRSDFKGYILDIGGPSANMYASECRSRNGCSRASCLVPAICPNLSVDTQAQLKLLRTASALPGVKKVFINSGVRVDLALECPEYMQELIIEHVSGQLSIAPEHMSAKVLKLMNKPDFKLYEKFYEIFNRINAESGKQQYIIPYFISSHPGSTLRDMYDMAVYMKKNKIKVEQVQNYTPIPMTLSSCMFYTGINPMTGESVHVPTGEERLMQRALLQPTLPANLELVRKALKQLGQKSL